MSGHHLDGGAGSTSWAVLDILVAVVMLHGLIAPEVTGLIIQAIGKNVSQSHYLHFTLLANQVLASSTRSRFGMHHSWLTAGGISGTGGLPLLALAANILLALLSWSQAQMSLHVPRLGSPLALLSSFKLFLIARAICAADVGCPPPDPAGRTTKKHYAARYAVGCYLLFSDIPLPPSVYST